MFHKVITGSLNKKIGGNIQVFPYCIFCIKFYFMCGLCVWSIFQKSRFVNFILDAGVHIIRKVTPFLWMWCYFCGRK